MTGGEGVDMVIDSVGQASWGDSLRSLRRGGRLVTCGATTGSNPAPTCSACSSGSSRSTARPAAASTSFARSSRCSHAGHSSPVIDKRYALDDVHAAFDRLHAGEQFGKVVVTVA